MVTAPKPGKVSTDLFYNATSGLSKVAAEQHCRMCGRHRSVRPLTRHHLVALSYFLHEGSRFRQVRNANANLVPLCRADHDLIEDGDPIARRMLRRLLSQQEVAFAIRVRGKPWFDSAYPME